MTSAPAGVSAAPRAGIHAPYAQPAYEAPPVLKTRRSRWAIWLVGRPGSAAPSALSRRIPRYAGWGLALALFGIVGTFGAVQGGHVAAMIQAEGAPRDIAARLLGFGVKAVTISGIAELEEIEVLQAAGVSGRQSLAFFDAEAARAGLKAVPLIADASVRKLFPDQLIIDIKERDAFALWQKDGDVFLIGEDGTPIDRLADARFLRLPFVVGHGANTRVKEFVGLLDTQPELKAFIKAGSLVGGRRWNLKLSEGFDVRLPEEGAPAALQRLAGLMREHKLSERGVLVVDLRFPDRVIFRLTEEAAEQHREDIKRRMPKWKGA